MTDYKIVFEKSFEPIAVWVINHEKSGNILTVCVFPDGTRTTSTCLPTDDYDLRRGIQDCITQYILGSKNKLKKIQEKAKFVGFDNVADVNDIPF